MSDSASTTNATRPTVSFDHHAAGLSADPYPTYADLRSGCPVAWSESHGGFWVLASYRAVYEASQDDDTFRSNPTVTIPPLSPRPMVPIEIDAPDAQQFRRVLTPVFSPAGVAALEPELRRTTDELIDEFIERGECDLIGDLGKPVPAITILRMLGFETDAWAEFADNADKMSHEFFSDLGAALRAAQALYQATVNLMEDRRTNGMKDDIVSLLLQAEINGHAMDDQDLIFYMLNLLNGGLDTTAGLFGNSLIRLQQHPELRRRMIDDPAVWPAAIEELLRLDGPVQGLARTVSKDTEFHGVRMGAGDRVWLLWASANRDGSEFSAPDRPDFDRVVNRHIAFGVGLHRCLGANLGRSMFRILLEATLERLPDLELGGDPRGYRYDNASTVYALKRLPARFTPGRRLGAQA